MTSPLAAALGLAAALAGIGWFRRARPRRFGIDPHHGLQRHGWWVIRATLGFALPAIAALAVLGRIDALATMPVEFAAVAAWLPDYRGALGQLLAVLALGTAGGIALMMLRVAVRRRRGRPPPQPIGLPSPLMPTRRGELVGGAAVAVAAGVTEEIAFRLFLPLMLAVLTGSALLAFIAATALFAFLHRYQGPLGMTAVAASGALLAALYLMSGALWLAMLFHAVVDLAGLVLYPALTGAWRR